MVCQLIMLCYVMFVNGLCQYRHIFGREGEGIHSIRVWDIAVIDLLLTLLAAYAISKYIRLQFLPTVILLLVTSVIIHRLFCVNTTLVKLLGLVPSLSPSLSSSPVAS